MKKLVRAFKITLIFTIATLILFVVKQIVFKVFTESEGSKLAYSYLIVTIVYFVSFINKSDWIEKIFKLND